jgi:hypothetical protein
MGRRAFPRRVKKQKMTLPRRLISTFHSAGMRGSVPFKALDR